MNLFDKSINRIEANASIKKSGGYVGIPYPYERLRQYIPSIDKEQVIGVTSFSGSGKSKFARHTYCLHPYEFSLHNNYNLLIDYWALEDSAEKVFKNFLCAYLHMKHKLDVSLFDLDSKFRELPSDIINKIKQGENYLQDFNNKVRIKDTLTSPEAIYADTLKTAESLGKVIYRESEEPPFDKEIVGFEPNDDTHWLILADNLNNIDKGTKHKDNKAAMDHFVQKDCRLLYSKVFKATCVVIHQQALEAERQQFTNTGGSIIERIKPSLANLGGTKEVVRSYHLVFSLFNPHKFKIENYRGYNVKAIGNNFRELEILKSNDGLDNVSTPLYFNGASEVFRELPNSEKQKEELQRFYEWLENERLKHKNKFLLF